MILLDIMMPDINGGEPCKQIKENENTKDILVIMVTVRGSDGDMSKSFQYGHGDGPHRF